MELADLNEEERVALAGLMKLAVMSDGNVSEQELEHVETMVDAFGEGAYQQVMEAFEARFRDAEAFKKFLGTLTRQEARELIFATVLESAGEGALEGPEADLLEWLSGLWNVRIEIADDAGR